MKPKYTTLSPEIFNYVCDNSSGGHVPILDQLRAETEELGEISEMLIGKDQGIFMSMLVKSISATSAIEVGTFTGYSSTCIALGLPEHGRLICVDQSEEWTQIARRYWNDAGVSDKIELRLGDGRSVLGELSSDEAFDFAFIDADKPGYDAYYELLLPHMRPNSLMLFDNMLRNGRVVNPGKDDVDTQALNALNSKLACDPRVDSVLLTVGDGINMCRKK
ncbi:MAG: class I SAM-dependent methyltransferase [Verrucomicrobia bacterium]|nr:class I SAM-dependent methyltransferase [Verrucomicrobiota bacterium]